MLSHHLNKFGVHKPYGTGNNGVCNISSNSNSNAEVQLPSFTNGQLEVGHLRETLKKNSHPSRMKQQSIKSFLNKLYEPNFMLPQN